MSGVLPGWHHRASFTNAIGTSMTKTVRWAILAPIIVGTLHACAVPTAADSSLFLPEDARDVRTDETQSGKQLSFTVKRKYPELAWRPSSLEKAQSSGWRKCSGSNLGRWTIHGDRTGPQAQMVHRYVEMMAKADRAMMITSQYYSPSSLDRGIPSSTPPANDDQHVTVLEVMGDVERTKSMFSAICS
jgi:hypothetical protein